MTIAALAKLVLVVLAIEAVGLWFATRRSMRLPRFWSLLPNLAAGLCLATAVLVTAEGGGAAAVGGLLAAAGVAHLADLMTRRRR